MPNIAHHDHAHHEGHDHGSAGHRHSPKNFGPAFAIGITLNLGFVVIEAGYGILSNSMALVADAGHNLSDVLGLTAAWIASVLVKRRPSPRFTYGLRGSSILAALFNAVFLLIATGAIILEAVQRLLTPQPVVGTTVMIVAAIGIAINGFTAWLFASGGRSDINIRGAYLHMMADAVVSLGVVVSGLIILATGFDWIDPFVSLVIAVLIIWSTWGLLRDSLGMALSAVPPNIDAAAVHAVLKNRPGISSLHDLHIWSMSTTEIALTAHLVTERALLSDDFLRETARELRETFGIAHATLQIERIGIGDCTLPAECEA
ncbi:cation diffusion facilitator family transporter [Methylobacterium brachythecii]|uniref:Cobalt-zinc-cadmium efflux system protein n=2 Tax=Methylobacterium brachythecii TaxID=1176177 RepID=A0A7W6ACE2_9HYPH|nr:cation diffusion facilitator family transporter [Methylobacterium brachythecii]MBB3900642.1 cobalt-zinc-cadmium efflux system protein [Methylobacterium brachythecii]